jgi:hypothetical protein
VSQPVNVIANEPPDRSYRRSPRISA